MRDLLNYYYYIIVDKINMVNHNYYFTYANNYFCLYKYDSQLKNINDIFALNSYMLYNNYQVNRIILNRDSLVVTNYGNHQYILILLTYNTKRLINLKDIIMFTKRNCNLKLLDRTNWLYLWSNKVDNIEYSIKHLMHKYKLIYNSIYYYIGLTENAITYLKLLNLENKNIGVCHNRLNGKTTVLEFCNPLNMVIDYRIRDLAEYLKACFFEKRMDVLMIINYLKRIKMSEVDYIYFYIRMLFPSYYFDIYDKVINGICKEEKILEITSYQEDYEYLLYEIYLLIKGHVNIIGLEWLNKKFMI